MVNNPLPSEDQRKALCGLMHEAFIELRYLDGEQAHDLAYAFHNIYGWGNWSIESMRGRLRYDQSKHQSNLGFNYVAAFDEIF